MATETLVETDVLIKPTIKPAYKPPIDNSDFPGASCALFSSESDGVTYGDWRDDLKRDGVAVVKGAIPLGRATAYADKMYQWLEELYAYQDQIVREIIANASL